MHPSSNPVKTPHDTIKIPVIGFCVSEFFLKTQKAYLFLLLLFSVQVSLIDAIVAR